MKLKTIQVGEDLREEIAYSSHSIPFSVCVDNFDEYFRREWECHWHDEVEFGIIRKGRAQFVVYSGQDQRRLELREGDGIFINSGYLHSARALVPDTVIAEFVLPVTFFNQTFENAASRILYPVIRSGIEVMALRRDADDDQTLLSNIDEICSISDTEDGYELHFVEMVYRIWRFLTMRVRRDSEELPGFEDNQIRVERLKRLLSYVHSHYSAHISVDEMARAAAVSRTECFRCFQEVLGKTPSAYLTEYRLSTAMTLLADTDRTVSDISYSCGFSSPSYFGRVFREQCKMSPRKYREKVRNI